jgi:molybdopterin-guanine dinucleotide biosynthesis protein A
MGGPKALLMLDGVPLLVRAMTLLREIADPVVIVAGPDTPVPDLPPTEDRAAPAPILRDRTGGKGPLEGLRAGLSGIAAMSGPPRDRALLVACDLPFVRREVLALLASRLDGDLDAVVPRTPGGPEPLLACYRATVLPSVEAALASRDVSMRSFLRRIRVRELDEETLRVADSDLRSFWNLNRPGDLEEGLRRFGLRPGRPIR